MYNKKNENIKFIVMSNTEKYKLFVEMLNIKDL